MTKKYSKQSAALILYNKDKHFLLQLRDDNPNIVYPAHWGLFGGEVESGENVISAFYRETQEELGYRPENIFIYKQFELDEDDQLIHLGIACLTVPLKQLHLGEGQDMGLFSRENIETGSLLSPCSGKMFNIAPPIIKCFNDLFNDKDLHKILL